MLNAKILATMSLGLLVAACGQPYQRQTASAPYPAPYQSGTAREMSLSERNCMDYGFTSPSSNYDRCVQREMRAREQGRVAMGYDQGRLVQDASNACYDYGLDRGTQRFDNCVSREVDARRYREQGPTPAPVAYYQPQPAPYYAPQPAPGPMRDEFGFRYDGQGNRLDASGRIIDPHTTNR
jgi:hypothetical protein